MWQKCQLSTVSSSLPRISTILYSKQQTLNCCKVVNDGNTDWLRFKCSAALRSVESEMLLDMLAEVPPLAREATFLPRGFSTGMAGAEAGADAPSA